MKIKSSPAPIDQFINTVLKYLDESLCDPIWKKMNARIECLGGVGENNRPNETETRYLIDEVFTFVRELLKHHGVTFKMEQTI
jgi:hypothetical protein